MTVSGRTALRRRAINTVKTHSRPRVAGGRRWQQFCERRSCIMKRFTKPATLEVITPAQVRLDHQRSVVIIRVKRMFAAVGNALWNCTANGLAPLLLDENLAPASNRPLTEEEIASVG